MPSRKSILLSMLFFNSTALAVAILLGFMEGNVHIYFGERRFITGISFLQLLIISGLSWKVFRLQAGTFNFRIWKSPHVVWAIIAAGFLFLSFDEVLKIHENIDKVIHHIFQIQETALTDRLDDIIVGFYGLIGLGTLIYYRNELKKYVDMRPYIISGFVLLFTMVGFDTLTNRKDILLKITPNSFVADALFLWFSVAEDSFKILAEGMFLVGFYSCLRIAKKQKFGPSLQNNQTVEKKSALGKDSL